MRRIRKPNEGYMLVELLASMAVLAVILVVLGTVITLTVRASERTGSLSNEAEEATRVVNAFVREIANLSPQRWSGAKAGFVFLGTEDRVSFAQFNAGDRGRELRLVDILGTTEGILKEERMLPPYAADVSDLPSPMPAAPLSDRYRVRFAYFTRLPNGGEVLFDTWSDTSLMPVAIRVSLSDGHSKTRDIRLPMSVDEAPRCGEQEDAACLKPVAEKKRPVPEW